MFTSRLFPPSKQIDWKGTWKRKTVKLKWVTTVSERGIMRELIAAPMIVAQKTM